MTQQEIEQANLANLAKQEKEQADEAAATLETERLAAVEAAKAEESVYKQENDRLSKENQQKTDALTVERSRRKKADDDAEAAKTAAEALAKANTDEKLNKGISKEDVNALLNEKLSEREFIQSLSQASTDPEEQKLIKHHYDNSIVKSGNVAEDLKKAIAIANQHIIEKARAQQIEREQVEGMGANFQSSRPYSRPGKPVYESDPRMKAAAAILDKLGVGDAKKYLGK